MSDLHSTPPVRPCCMQRHYGVVCPDNKVMCCYCFDRFDQEDLAIDPVDGQKIDVCKNCKKREDEQIAAKRSRELDG